jgi:predicted ArsR family transcriptional regulator
MLLLLRRARRTVKELAEALGLAENAVRVHLAAMQRSGLVEQDVRRTPGAGKPAYEYRLSPQAQSMFPVAHGVVLDSLLSEMESEMSPADYERQLRAAGRRMASRYPVTQGSMRARLEEVVGVLDNLGGLLEIEEEDNAFLLCGYSCPLFTMPQAHPGVCNVLEEMLTSIVGVPVRARCERGDQVACKFEVPKI